MFDRKCDEVLYSSIKVRRILQKKLKNIIHTIFLRFGIMIWLSAHIGLFWIERTIIIQKSQNIIYLIIRDILDLIFKCNSCLIWDKLGDLHEQLLLSADILQDTFFLIWTTSVAIVIFIIENSKEYKYGITVKKIIGLSTNPFTLYVGTFLYLLLCPVFLVARLFDYTIFMFFLVVDSFSILFIVLFLWIWKSTGKQIKKLLSQTTVLQIQNSCNERKYNIDEVIEHMDYNSNTDIIYLRECLREIYSNNDKNNLFNHRTGCHTWLMGRIYRLISKFDFSEKYQRILAGDLLWEIWNDLIFDKNLNDKICIDCTLQILIPFITIENKNANEILFRLCRRMGEKVESVWVYLLCYSEYVSLSENVGENFWLFQRNDYLKGIRNRLSEKKFLIWDVQYALELWIDWERFQKYEDNYGLKYFWDFEGDVRKLQKGVREQFCTFIMKYACGV